MNKEEVLEKIKNDRKSIELELANLQVEIMGDSSSKGLVKLFLNGVSAIKDMTDEELYDDYVSSFKIKG